MLSTVECSYKESVLLGHTLMSPDQIQQVLEQLALEWYGPAYNLRNNNCNSFTNAVSLALLSEPIPTWVNKAARVFGGDAQVCVQS